MAHAAILLADGFETCEALVCADVMRRAGIRCGLVSTTGTSRVMSGQLVQLVADESLGELLRDGLPGCVVVPGGIPAVRSLSADEDVLGLLRGALSGGSAVGASSAACALLAQAGLPGGARVVDMPSLRGLVPPDALVDQDVLADGRLVTARSARCALEFALALAEAAGGAEARRRALQSMGPAGAAPQREAGEGGAR